MHGACPEAAPDVRPPHLHIVEHLLHGGGQQGLGLAAEDLDAPLLRGRAGSRRRAAPGGGGREGIRLLPQRGCALAGEGALGERLCAQVPHGRIHLWSTPIRA